MKYISVTLLLYGVVLGGCSRDRLEEQRIPRPDAVTIDLFPTDVAVG